MDSFLSLLAKKLYSRYGDEISSLCIIFPSRRARLFFTDALSQCASKPLWQPGFSTVDELMQYYSRLRKGEKIPLIAELYKIYSGFHRESFDSFYYWGEMLLSDFDSVDKYLIDAGMLFRNVAQLREMESDNSYLTAEQAGMIARFWSSFGHRDDYSDEKRKFIDIWSTLEQIYGQYRKALREKGIAYGGMLYRDAVENIKQGVFPDKVLSEQRYIIAGFNALTECEKVLFKHLSARGKAEFYWDYDDYYTGDLDQEAGLFMRENIKMFPQYESLGDISNFTKRKNIRVVSAPSDSLQCKYAGQVIGGLCDEGKPPGKETAIVLTNENLLMPVLASVPDQVRDINVTMGYPLKLTSSYTLFERLVELQSRKRVKEGKTLYRYADLTGILSHPFIAGIVGARHMLEIVRKSQLFYQDITGLDCKDSILQEILTGTGEQWEDLSRYLLSSLSAVASCPSLSGDIHGLDRDHLALIEENIRRTCNSLITCGLEITAKTFLALLRKVLQTTRIPFEGEPLRGIQVMGILETRNLDFENVIVLSMNDDNFPGNRVSAYSFIPYSLRYAYGLPTPAHHEGVYAYYFYRLMQRAENIDLVYSSKSDEKSNGEQSRYIYQLLYESPHKLRRLSLGLDVNVAQPEAIQVDKAGEVAGKLDLFLCGEKMLSPSSFNNYVACPLKFYFHSIAGLKEDEEPGEEIDAPMFGTILHRAMDILYKPFCGKDDPRGDIRQLVGSPAVAEAVNRAIKQEYLNGLDVKSAEYGGNMVIVSEIIRGYINKCILPFDASQEPFTILKTEEPVNASFETEYEGKSFTVLFRGHADRIDLLPDGKYRVVDYKTGREERAFNGVDALFSPLYKDRNPSALQTMLYGLMMSRTMDRDVQPALYYVRNLNICDYSPLLWDRTSKAEVVSYHKYRSDFEELLAGKLSELFDYSNPFIQCGDVKTCQFCDFKKICKR